MKMIYVCNLIERRGQVLWLSVGLGWPGPIRSQCQMPDVKCQITFILIFITELMGRRSGN